MKNFLIIFSMFLIDEKSLKCSQQEPFRETLATYFNQVDQIKQTALKTIIAFNQRNPNLTFKQQRHDRHGHFVFESTEPHSPCQLKFRPHVHFQSFIIQLKKPGQESVKQIVGIHDLNAIHATIVTMLSKTPCP